MPSGLVVKSTGSWYTVRADDGMTVECRIRGKFRMSGLRTTNPVAAGDRVEFEWVEQGRTGSITDIAPRKNYIIRKSSNLSHEAHILAANLDKAYLIITLKFPETPVEFVDRFLVTAEAYSVPVCLVFNKTDLYTGSDTEALSVLEKTYGEIGYEILRTSVPEGLNLDRLREMTRGKISLFSGNSGVGKSSLINALNPSCSLKTGEISDFHHKGKHTTTFAEMIALEDGGYIIDTPGIKGFGVIRMEKTELSHFFPEIFSMSSNCQYYNCHHVSEPGCAVKTAVQQGLIMPSRYNSYLNLFLEEDEKYRAAY
ncbi:MAG: ribosome small subunit-dependent GTPase A [Bacteroidales bacterium]|nr:ribosome small subunit-dependent GTPase A [Bacteroidales bacterium]